MPDDTELTERLAEALFRAMANPEISDASCAKEVWRYARAAARAVLPIVEDYAKAERNVGAVDGFRDADWVVAEWQMHDGRDVPALNRALTKHRARIEAS